MAAPVTNDFSAFAGSEHMFFGLAEPFAMIRCEVEKGLRKQVADSVVERIETHGTPKFLTLGRKTGDGSQVIAAHFAFSVLARLSVSYAGGTKRETIDSALTFMFVHIDSPGKTVFSAHFDLHGDASENFTDEHLQRRFLSFRSKFP